MKKLIILFLVIFSQATFSQKTLLLPLNDDYRRTAIFASKNLFTSYPMAISNLDSAKLEHVFGKQAQRTKWLGRKLFNENFVQLRKENFYLTVDPVLDLRIGSDLEAVDKKTLYQNTRGIRIEGEILGQLSFHTSYFENQSVFATYLTDAYKSRGEQKLKNGNYITEHAMIPGGARTKPFGNDGFDYGFSSAYVRWEQSKFFEVQFGNYPEFIGYGKRSLLISDFSYNTTQLKLTTHFLNRFSYSFQVGKATNLLRRKYFSTVEAPFERKGRTTHILNYKPTKSLDISFFESGIWFKEDSIRSINLPVDYYLPLPVFNVAKHGFEDASVKNLIGLNVGYRFLEKYMVYTQVITDNIKDKQYGVQLGARAYHRFKNHLIHLMVEVNTTSDRLYSAQNNRLSYSNNNLPIAYALGNGTQEFLFEINYSYKNIYTDVFFTAYKNFGYEESLDNIFFPQGIATNSLTRGQTLFSRVEIGYRFNLKTNLKVFAAGAMRKENIGNTSNLILQFGLKTAFRNQHHNY